MLASALRLAGSAAGRVTIGGARRRARGKPIELTAAAVDRIKALLATKPDVSGVRLGVKTRGCNGLSYTLDYATEINKLDEVVEEQGVQVVIEPKALMTVIGTTMDWYEDPLRAEFVFHNPNAKGACGCGESFSV